jgi:hypothetical protein
MRCETFDTLAIGSKIGVYFHNPVPNNTWQPPNGDFWGSAFVLPDGTLNQLGHAQITKARRAGSAGNEVMVNNINLCFSANFGQVLRHIRIAFGEYGGNLNLLINRQFVNFKNFGDIDGSIIGGVKVNVLSGGTGNDSGEIEFVGDIGDQRWSGHLAIGGQELWVDNVCWD